MYGSYPPPNHSVYGGVERVEVNLIDSLCQFKNLDVNVLSRRGDIKKDFQIERGGITLCYFAKRRPKIISSLVRDLPALAKKMEGIAPDLVHAQGCDGAFASLKVGYPTVMTLHGIVWKEAKYRGLKRLGEGIIYTKLTRYVLKRLNHLIVISPYADDEVKHLTEAQKYYIENPIPNRFFEIKNKNTQPIILYLGVINPRKDPLTLIRAFSIIKKENPEVELRIVGKITDERYYQTILRFISKYNLANNIHFLGRLSDEELEAEYSTCSLLCLPSNQENVPMVIAEAMAAGKPVVATNICGIPFMVDEGKTGFLFEVGEVQTLAEKIRILLQDENLRRNMGVQAKEVARKRWRSEIIAKKTIEVYKEILSKEQKGF